MQHEMGVEPLFRQFRHDGIDQKRHVVVKNFNNRDVIEALTWGRLQGANPDLGRLQTPLAEKPPSSLSDLGNLRGLIMDNVFRGGAGEDLLDEVRWHIDDAA